MSSIFPVFLTENLKSKPLRHDAEHAPKRDGSSTREEQWFYSTFRVNYAISESLVFLKTCETH